MTTHVGPLPHPQHAPTTRQACPTATPRPRPRDRPTTPAPRPTHPVAPRPPRYERMAALPTVPVCSHTALTVVTPAVSLTLSAAPWSTPAVHLNTPSELDAGRSPRPCPSTSCSPCAEGVPRVGYALAVGSIELAAAVRGARGAAGLSVRDAAAACDLAKSHYQRLERGEVAAPTVDVLGRLAAGLGTTRSSLMRAAGYL